MSLSKPHTYMLLLWTQAIHHSVYEFIIHVLFIQTQHSYE